MTQRLYQFDILKGIGILCVLLGHSALSGFPKEIIYGFHMPLFFFCSGVFFKDRNLRETITKSIKQLLFPYLFFLLVLLSCDFVLYLKATHSLYETVTSIYNSINCPLNEDCRLYLTIWFLPCLFIVRILYALLYRCCKCNEGKLLAISIIAGGGYFIGNHITLPFFLDSAISCLIYYHFGYCFYKYNLYKIRLALRWTILLGFLYILTVALLHPHVDLKYNTFPFYLIILSSMAIIVLYQFSLFLSKESNVISAFLIKCGNCSLTMLGLHRPVWLFVYPICLKFEFNEYMLIIVEMITAVSFIRLADKILNKYAPTLIGKQNNNLVYCKQRI